MWQIPDLGKAKNNEHALVQFNMDANEVLIYVFIHK